MYGHIGQGCIHTSTDFDLRSKEGIAKYRAFVEEAADLVVSYGGTLSGEHGDGQARAELLPKQFGEEIVEAFREFKRIWDPDWKMNPGKVVDAYRLDENLKLGADYNPWRPPVKFSYSEDHGDFAHATVRCVGVGKCRQPDGEDVMCPSLHRHPRGDAHDTRPRSPAVRDARRRRRRGRVAVTRGDGSARSLPLLQGLHPRLPGQRGHADLQGRVPVPPLQAQAPAAACLRVRAASTRPHAWPHASPASSTCSAARRSSSSPPGCPSGGRSRPSLHSRSSAGSGSAAGRTNPNGRRVVLYPDTFNNHFHTDVGVAAVEAIEAAGWQVVMPEGHVCCGRPLYDYGFLDLAERYLRRNLDGLRQWYREDVPIVGMEPSCVAVFKDELGKLLPYDDDANRLAGGVYHFAEFFKEFGIEPPPLHRKAFVWGHCHHKATGGIDPEVELLKAMGVETETMRAGCCGLAGSWGFEAEHYDVSTKAGEHGLLPKVRELEPMAIVVADGFSCKTQIEQGDTGRRALHLAQVLKLAREHGAEGPPGAWPERGYYERRPPAPLRTKAVRAAVAGAALAAVGALAWQVNES